MTQEEQDEKEFEEWLSGLGEWYLNGRMTNARKADVKIGWIQSRRMLREKLRNVTTKQENLDPKIVEFVSKNFWDLI